MSEMLGNQFFLARNYAGAANELEKALKKDPASKYVQRKLVVCYSQINKLEKAFNVFYDLAKRDMDFIINAKYDDAECPCPELV